MLCEGKQSLKMCNLHCVSVHVQIASQIGHMVKYLHMHTKG